MIALTQKLCIFTIYNSLSCDYLLLLSNSTTKYGVLGLDEKTIMQAATTVGVLVANIDVLLTKLGKERKNFHDFCDYLVHGEADTLYSVLSFIFSLSLAGG